MLLNFFNRAMLNNFWKDYLLFNNLDIGIIKIELAIPVIARIIPNWTEDNTISSVPIPIIEEKYNKLPSLIPQPPTEIGSKEINKELGKIRLNIKSSSGLKLFKLQMKINNKIEKEWLNKE